MLRNPPPRATEAYSVKWLTLAETPHQFQPKLHKNDHFWLKHDNENYSNRHAVNGNLYYCFCQFFYTRNVNRLYVKSTISKKITKKTKFKVKLLHISKKSSNFALDLDNRFQFHVFHVIDVDYARLAWKRDRLPFCVRQGGSLAFFFSLFFPFFSAFCLIFNF